MIRFQKRNVLLHVKPPTYIRKEAKGGHNELTLAIIKCALPLRSIMYHEELGIRPDAISYVLKEAKNLRGTGIEFNENFGDPIFFFTVKAKTERRGNDVPNQSLADKIALAKANRSACNVAKRIISSIAEYYTKEASHMSDIAKVAAEYAARESDYIHKV